MEQYSIFIFYKSSLIVKEFSISNMNKVTLLKTLPLYNYTAKQVFLSDSGLFYVLGEKNQTVYMLIYRSNSPLINSLYSIIPLNVSISVLDEVFFHVDGIQMDTCVLL